MENQEPSDSYDSAENHEPSNSCDSAENQEPSKSYDSAENQELSKSYDSTENQEPSKSCDSAENHESSNSCDSADSTDSSEQSEAVCSRFSWSEILNQLNISRAEERKLKVVTSDGKEYELTRSVIRKSIMLSNTMMCSVSSPDSPPAPLYYISSSILEKIIEFCEHDSDLHFDSYCECELTDWHRNTFFWINQTTLCELLEAADFLDMRCLFKLSCHMFATLIKDCPIEEIRKILGVKNDFKPYEYRIAEAEANNILQRRNFRI